MAWMTSGALGTHTTSSFGGGASATGAVVQPPASASAAIQARARQRGTAEARIGVGPGIIAHIPGGMPMSAIDPVWSGVADLSRAFADRLLSPVDVVDALLERIRKRDPTLHAYIAVYEADARLAAEGADKAFRAGHRVGPLHGIPVALKDLVDLEGRVTTGGSKVWANRVSPVTATLAERL